MIVEQVPFSFSDHRLQMRPGDVFAGRLSEELFDECRVEVLCIPLPPPARLPSRTRNGARRLLGRVFRDLDVLTGANQVTVGKDGGPASGGRFWYFDPTAVWGAVEHMLHRCDLRAIRSKEDERGKSRVAFASYDDPKRLRHIGPVR
jgi:hypothetical protein